MIPALLPFESPSDFDRGCTGPSPRRAGGDDAALAELLAALAPDNPLGFALPIVPRPRDPFADDDTPDPNAPAVPVGPDEELSR